MSPRRSLGRKRRTTARTLEYGGADVLSAVEQNVTGPLPQPKTTAGEYARTIGEFAPGAVLGPGGVVKNLTKFGVAPAIASETAGQATEGTKAEPFARLAGALLAGGAASLPSGQSVPRTPSVRDEVVGASQRLNVPVPHAAVGDRPTQQYLAAKLREIPVAGAPIRKAAQETVEGLGTRADEIKSAFGSGSRASAGSGATDVLGNWVSKESSDLQEQLYSQVGQLVNANKTKPLSHTKRTVSQIAKEQQASTSTASNPAINLIEDAINRPEGLTYEGLKNLRTDIGARISGKITPEPGTSQPALKRLYEALSKDLGDTAHAAGGQKARKAWEHANRVSAQISKKRGALTKIVGMKGDAPSDAVLNRITRLAGQSDQASVPLLRQVKETLGPSSWNEVVSTIVGSLGRDARMGENYFSPDRFLTAFAKLSDEGKNVLFGSHRQALEDIAIISRQDKILKQLGNPAGTGGTVLTGFAGAGLAISPLDTIATILGGNILSRILSRPATTRKLADWAKMRNGLAQNKGGISRSAFLAATRDLAKDLSHESGQDAADIERRLIGTDY